MTTNIRFTKMHGLGNDFMVLDGINQTLPLNAKKIRQLSNRHTGVGFDQCLMIEPPKTPDYDFHYRIYNADGTEVGQCGNGARCLAVFIRDKKLSNQSQYRVKTNTSDLLLEVKSGNEVWVEFNEPSFSPSSIPLKHEVQADYYPFELNDVTHYLHCLSVGNPHGIMIVNELSDDLIEQYGLRLSQHPTFLEGANISFAAMRSKQHVDLRVFERGAGETNACGSAALATAACLRLFHKAAQRITVTLPGGQLTINWQGLGHKINFTGPAVSVFDGTIAL